MSNSGDDIVGNFHIQNYVNYSVIKYLVGKGVIDIGEFREAMKESEFNLRKALPPDVTQNFSKNISVAFETVSMNIQSEE